MSLPDYYEQIFKEVERDLPIRESLKNIAFWADGRNPNLKWIKLPEMLGEEEIDSASTWFNSELDKAQIESSVVLYFEMKEYRGSLGNEFSDAGLTVYRTIADGWPASRDCSYSNADLSSRYMRNIGAVCKRNPKPRYIYNDGYIGFNLAYACLLARELCKSEKVIQHSHLAPIKVGVGYAEGDILEVMNISKGSITYEKKYA